MAFLLLFIAIPLIEIALFIQVGSILGLGWTLLIVVITAVLGTALLRRQGRGVLMQLQRSLGELNDPTEPLAHGAMIILAGALLLTPGFFTDTVGFLLMVPKVREAAFRWIRQRMVVTSSTSFRGTVHRDRSTSRGPVIDGEYEEIDAEPRRTRGPSGWTRD